MRTHDLVNCPFCNAMMSVGLRMDKDGFLQYAFLGVHLMKPKNPNNVKCEQIDNIREETLDNLSDALLIIKKATI